MLALVQTRLTEPATSLVVGALLAASSVFVGSAWSARSELLVHFVLPGGDTECEMVDPDLLIGNVTCGIHRHRYTCVGVTCDQENAYSRQWFVDVDRFGTVGLNTAADPSVGPAEGASFRAITDGRLLPLHVPGRRADVRQQALGARLLLEQEQQESTAF